MSNYDKTQERMLRQARPAAPPREAGTDEQRFCPRCQAVATRVGTCPHCDLHHTTYQRFCRNCLRVHSSTASCRRWSPSES